MLKARKHTWFDWHFIVLGVVVGVGFLYGVSSFLGSAIFSLASPLPLALWPEPHLSVGGFRVHHWMVGLVIIGVGCIVRGRIGSVLLGAGLVFVADDAYDLIYSVSSLSPNI